jgi:ABC-type uncharacterized transport system permease subunit
VGGIAGLGFAVLFGWVTTRKSGTTFAMITLGLGELVFAMSLMIPEFFGGEGGVSSNRVIGKPFLGITFGPPMQVYYLIAVYTFLAVAAMYAFTRTPLGRMLNAVRDNPERVEFVGYNTQRVRYTPSSSPDSSPASLGGWAACCSRSSRPRWSVLPARGPTCCSPSWVAPRSSSGLFWAAS